MSSANVEVRDSALLAIVDARVAFEAIATGFLFTEGPLWDVRNRRLLFSDIPGNVISAWSARGTQDFRRPSNMSNGLTFDRQGRVLCCEHATSRVTRLEADGSVTVLASTFEGKELNSPNDIVVKTDGAIYFTDPTYGRLEYYGVPRQPQLGFRGVYRVDADGRNLTLLADDFAQPNGLCFSPDEKTLYVDVSEQKAARIMAYDVQADGTLAAEMAYVDEASSLRRISVINCRWLAGRAGPQVLPRGLPATEEVSRSITATLIIVAIAWRVGCETAAGRTGPLCCWGRDAWGRT